MKAHRDTALSSVIAASTFAALGSEQRLLVLNTLVRAGADGLTIGELSERTGITGSTLTHHLKVLTQADLVTQERKGRSIICAAPRFEVVEALSRYLLSECCADADTCHKDHDHG